MLLDELVTCAGPEVVADVEELVIELGPTLAEVAEKLDIELVSTLVELVEDGGAIEGVGVLVLMEVDELLEVVDDWLVEDCDATEGVEVLVLAGIGELVETADTWLVITTGTVGVGAVVVALTRTTLVCETDDGTTVETLVLVDAASSDCGFWALQKSIKGANSGSTYV